MTNVALMAIVMYSTYHRILSYPYFVPHGFKGFLDILIVHPIAS